MPYRTLPKDYQQMKRIAAQHIGQPACEAIEAINHKRKFGRGGRIFWDLVDAGEIAIVDDCGLTIIEGVKVADTLIAGNYQCFTDYYGPESA
jgi:hypothetical protein